MAVPFYDPETMRGAIPESWNGFQVIDGDKTDLRFLDQRGVIVGLRCKLPKRRTLAIAEIRQTRGFYQPAQGWVQK